ncbi:MAG: zinc-ribbon domain-containing protein [Nitrosopumilus sp.]|nr:zinc-ribbon domain-containing protein [Nitrosopumilus sp.]
MKPQSCRNCGMELYQNQRVCPKCGRETDQDDPDK